MPSLLGYNVVKLGVRYPSSGGLIAYLLQGFGNDALSGSPPGSATSRQS
jgi:amino acid transporter